MCLSSGRWECGASDQAGCVTSAAAALGVQRSLCGFHALWTQTHHYYSYYQVMIHFSYISDFNQWLTESLVVNRTLMFTPKFASDLCRNNLTVFDMVMVKGHGAKELLRVGGKLPGLGASLRFNVPQSTLMECRDGTICIHVFFVFFFMNNFWYYCSDLVVGNHSTCFAGLRTNKPLFAIRKSFKVENAGELPLTVMSMNINGYKCQGFGFEVLQCRSFSLDHNSSAELTIA